MFGVLRVWGLGVGVGSGFRVQGLEPRVPGLGLAFGVWGLVFGIWGLWVGVWGALGLRV